MGDEPLSNTRLPADATSGVGVGPHGVIRAPSWITGVHNRSRTQAFERSFVVDLDVPNERFEWSALTGAFNRGVVSFTPLSDNRTRLEATVYSEGGRIALDASRIKQIMEDAGPGRPPEKGKAQSE